jgi:hypothetical protein
LARQHRQSLILAFGKVDFEHDVLALDIAGLLQALTKTAQSSEGIAAEAGLDTRPPASPAAARAPRAATSPRRQAA